MNRSNFAKKITYGIAVSLIFMTSVAHGAVVVTLKVDESGTEPTLAVDNNTSPCTAGDTEDPCILVQHGTRPHMFFKLENACQGPSNPEYKLTDFRITMIDKVWPTAGSPLNGVVAADFNAVPETGFLDWSSKNNKIDKHWIKLKNFNSHEYTVFYEVTASPCKDDDEKDDIYLDPEIRNRGND